MLKEIIRKSINHNTKAIFFSMSHRGRINVLVNILGKNINDLFEEFSIHYKSSSGSGDVKYHQGFSSNIKTKYGSFHLSLAFNPSHLEIINPVLIGSVRAHIDQINKTKQKKK